MRCTTFETGTWCTLGANDQFSSLVPPWTPSLTASPFACHARSEELRTQGYKKRPLRVLEHHTGPNRKIIGLIEIPLDLVYCYAHCNANVLTHLVLHGLVFWAKRCDEIIAEKVSHSYREYITQCPYEVPLAEACGRKDWKLSANATRALLHRYAFLDKLVAILPRSQDGLQARAPSLYNGNHCLLNPLQFYVKKMRRLLLQLGSWAPVGVETRTREFLSGAGISFCIWAATPLVYCGDALLPGSLPASHATAWKCCWNLHRMWRTCTPA